MAVASSVALAGCGEPDSGPPRGPANTQLAGPNVVLIVADDLGWADVGWNGSEIDTWNLDRLAAEGVVLSNFHTTPACTMTRAALMTGRSAVHFGLWYSVLSDHSAHGLPAAEYTIAERFRDAGYATALIGKWHLGHARPEYHPNSQGFDSFFGCMVCSRDYRTHAMSNGLGHDLQRDGFPIDGRGEYMTDLLAGEAVRTIRGRDPSRPLFLVVSFQAPHIPIQPPPALRNKYELRGLPPLRASYAGVVDRLDQGVGRILSILDAERIADETIVVVMSDNGGSAISGADNRPLRGEKMFAFEGGVRVPAVIRYPGVLEPGTVNAQLARESDLFATLERAAGLSLRAPAESYNFWPQLQGAPLDDDRDFVFAFNWKPIVGNVRGVLSGNRWKYVALQNRSNSGIQANGAIDMAFDSYLFDLENDPMELWNLADEEPERVRELEQLFEDVAATHPAGGLRDFEDQPVGWQVPHDLTVFIPPSVLRRR